MSTSVPDQLTLPGTDLRPDPLPPRLDHLAARADGQPAAWDWAGQTGSTAGVLAQAAGEFAAFYNRRYAWASEHTIPPCWADHPALVEEITTLMWSRWAAFQGPLAAAEAAQNWHTYQLPMFLKRIVFWVGSPEAAADCRASHHQTSRLDL